MGHLSAKQKTDYLPGILRIEYLTHQELEKLGNDLMALNDGIDAFGLVNFELGVWEETILYRKL